MSFRLQRQPNPNEFFVCGADPAEGHDYCAAHWLSKSTQEVVLTFQGRMESTQFGYELAKGSTLIYKATGLWPTIAVERNTGQATIARLLDLNYPSLYRHQDTNRMTPTEDDKIGWPTNVATRQQMLDDLALVIKQRVLHVYDKPTLKEMLHFIRNPKTGKPEAEKGTTSDESTGHDDLVMALAIAWQMYNRVSTPMNPNLELPDDQSILFTDGGFY